MIFLNYNFKSIIYKNKRRVIPSSILAENYLQFLALLDLLAELLDPQFLVSVDASTLFFVDILPLLADLPILEFLPNIVFTSLLFKV